MIVLLTRHSNNQPVSLTKQIADSGEGQVWETDINGYLAKIYHDPTPARIAKLKVMLANPPADPMLNHNHVSIAWVSDLLKDSNGKYLGFLMPAIRNSKQLSSICNPKLRKRNAPSFNWYYLHVTALNTAWIIQEIHAKGYVLGDIKLENILVNDRAMTAVIDTDSFQVRDTSAKKVYLCTVGSEGFTPPELIGKDFHKVKQSQNQDRFRLAVLIHYLLFGYHPFSGSWTGVGECPEQTELIKHGYWYGRDNSPIRESKTTISLDVVHPKLKQLFLQCFNDGHEQSHLRPSAKDWHKALETAVNDLTACNRIDNHHYSKHYGKCYWCDRADTLGVDIFPGVSGCAQTLYREQNYSPPKVSRKYKKEIVFSVDDHSNQNNTLSNSTTKQHYKKSKQPQYKKQLSLNLIFVFVRDNYAVLLTSFFCMLLVFILVQFDDIQYEMQNYDIDSKNELEKRRDKVISLSQLGVSQGKTYYSSGKYVKAITTYVKAIDMHIERGVYLTNVAKYLEAIAHYDRALDILSYIAASYYHKGKEEFELGNYTQAIKNYSQAVYLNSILLESNIDYRQLMEAYIEREQAISKLQNRSAINQDWETNSYNIYLSNIYFGRGVALYKWGDKDDAHKNFSKSKSFGNKRAIEWLKNFQYDKKDPSSQPSFYNK